MKKPYRHIVQLMAFMMIIFTLILYQISVLSAAPNILSPSNISYCKNGLCSAMPKKSDSTELKVKHHHKDRIEADEIKNNLNYNSDNYLYSDFSDSYYVAENTDPAQVQFGSDTPSSTGAFDTHSNSQLQENMQKSLSKSFTYNQGKRKKKFSSRRLAMDYYQRRKSLLESLFLSVKTTSRFHQNRIQPLVDTWFKLASEQTWIFTDKDDSELAEKTNGHMINTQCPSTHLRQALCCKMSVEFDTFFESQKSWFCHFDDDNYVNVPALLDLLDTPKYSHRDYWYLGKPSLKSSITIMDPDNRTEQVSFSFATGGAGFCLSRALALRMSPLAKGGRFIRLCDKIQLPDDVTVGFIVGHLLGQNLTLIPEFHSHFEPMGLIDMKNAHNEITFSYLKSSDRDNVLDVQGFSKEEDPTRFLSLHCHLFPNFSFCPKSGT